MRDPIRAEIQRPYDVVVIGAGINGAGIARDAAMRGLRVLVLDKGDIGGSTTARSTRLIHGGLRYLEHYEFALVREALREREIHFRIAPHAVRPLRFLVPIYEDFRRPAWMVRLGMLGYDALSFDRSFESHRMLSPTAALRREPGLLRDGLRCAALYHDAQVEYPERLTVEALIAAREHGATVVTHARVERLHAENGEVREVEFTDLLTGGTHRVRSSVTVNVTGPWVDQLLERAPGSFPRQIGGTKGSHIVLDPFPGAPRDAVYVEAPDGRPYFIVPWIGRYLIGTTDLRYDGDLDTVAASWDEIDYLIASTNRIIPAAHLTRDHVLYSYAGVRPLPYTEERTPGQITRSHIIREHDEVGGLLSIIGGKITTWRRLAEEVVDTLLKKLDRPDPGCRTARVPLPGGAVGDFGRFAARFRRRTDLPAAAVERILTVYGCRVHDVLALAEDDGRLGQPVGDCGLLGAEVLHALRHELAETIADVIFRRSMIGLEPDNGASAAEPAARLAAEHLGWDRARVRTELDRYEREAALLQP
ncbi:MAG TPA: glycerol-3-phosphate dehydrogenase [Nitriliruptorales bacterium]|nr:glycerol-3-phosphate dehydrogenase [Nitriliruptorales bacterium]